MKIGGTYTEDLGQKKYRPAFESFEAPQAIPLTQLFQLRIAAPISHRQLVLLLLDINKSGLGNVVSRVVEDLEGLPNLLGGVGELLRQLGHEVIFRDRAVIRREHD